MTDQQTKNKNYELYSKQFDQGTFSIIDTIIILARNLKILIITPTIFCIITFIYVQYFAKPMYSSTAKIISSSGDGLSKAAGLAAQFGVNIPTGQKEVKWVYPSILKSRTLARAVLKRKFNTQKYGDQKSLLQILTHGNSEPDSGMDTLEFLAIEKFLSMFGVTENKGTGIFTIELLTFEPRLASEITAALIEELDIHQQEYNRAKTNKTRRFIEERIYDVGKELDATEEALREFAVRNRRIENSPTLQLEQQRLSREVTVITGVFTTLKQQLETAKIEEVKESDYVVVLDPPDIPIVRSEPKKKQSIILAGILGIALGMVIGFIREYFSNSDNDERQKLNQARSLFLNNLSELFFLKGKK